MKRVKKSSITLSGTVFINGHLLEEIRPLLVVPTRVSEGDLRITAVLEQGAADAGFLTACIFDGRGWRKFFLREAAQGPATFKDRFELVQRAASVIATLEQLKDCQAESIKHGYVVIRRQAQAPQAVSDVPQEDDGSKLLQLPLPLL